MITLAFGSTLRQDWTDCWMAAAVRTRLWSSGVLREHNVYSVDGARAERVE